MLNLLLLRRLRLVLSFFLCRLLHQFEADRRAINITINSFGTELRKEEREALYPNFGLLYPEGTKKLGQADRVDQVKDIVDTFSVRALTPLPPSVDCMCSGNT